jgi:hypothetical protein
MSPLLADSRIASYDLIALQEPWQNPYCNRTYCPSASGFLPAYDDRKRRSCFLINRRLDPTLWSVEYPSPDLAVLCLQAEDRTVWIYNIYSPPPGSYSIDQYDTPISILPDLLSRDGDHLLLGDFNLHHPMWCGPRNPTAHKAADRLVDLILSYDLSLASPKGGVTWEARGQSSTIDLTFLSPRLQEQVVRCEIREDLDFGADHYPISTSLLLRTIQVEPILRRSWKRMDIEAVQAGAAHLPRPPALTSSDKVEEYTTLLVQAIQCLIDQTVPWAKPSSYGQPWWTIEVQDAVEEERILRQKLRTSQDYNSQQMRTATQKKVRTIRKAKQKSFRTMMHEACEGNGLWRMANWARTTQGSYMLPVMPPLATDLGVATSLPDKVQALRQRFYPIVRADLEDITDSSFEDSSFPDPLAISQAVDVQEVLNLLRTRRTNKAPGSDSIPNDFLKAMGEPLAAAVAAIATACWKLGYYPKQFKHARTVVIRKPGKAAYDTPGAWRPIALLNTIGKLIEALTANRLQDAAEEHGLLPDTQMGARRGRSTETALELLVEQVRTIWTSKKHVASLLSLDISGAFDTVNPTRLLDTLRKKRIPGWLVRWVQAFMTDRTTTLVVQGQESEPFPVEAGVPQGSTLSPILFLFYNAELLDICNQPRQRLSAVGFADDINILTYGLSTETNCRTIEQTHSRCLDWARRFGMSFAPAKYELIHFTRHRTKFNLQASLNLGTVIKSPALDVRVLGVWLDSKLQWTAHAREVKKKALIQQLALQRISASTWGATFVRARQIYTAVVRPAVSYGVSVWRNPLETRAGKLMPILRSIQNSCLRTVAGAYRATPIRSLEVETYIPPVDIYLDSRVAAFQRRLENSRSYDIIQRACSNIRARLKSRVARRTKTQGQLRKQWTEQRAVDQGDRTEDKQILYEWTQRWEIEQNRVNQKRVGRRGKGETYWDLIRPPPGRTILKLHQNLRKAESSALVQFRTGRTGLASFLYWIGVPEFQSPICPCGQGEETPYHVLRHCPLEEGNRQSLRTMCGGGIDVVRLLNTPEGAGVAARWIVQSGRLNQFRVAKALSYE